MILELFYTGIRQIKKWAISLTMAHFSEILECIPLLFLPSTPVIKSAFCLVHLAADTRIFISEIKTASYPSLCQ